MERLIAAFSWMLIHSLWQGMLFAAMAAVTLLFTQRWKAASRYNLVIVMFAGFLLTAVYTFMAEWNTTDAGTATVFANGLGARVSQLFFGNLQQIKQWLDGCTAYCSAHEQVIVMAWLVIFAFRAIKMLGALSYNHRVKTRQVKMPDAYWQQVLSRLCTALQINKAVLLLESGYMKMPVVIGHLKPVILMPAGLLLSLTPEQAEAILLHELAHIKRNDYLINFLQHIVATIFFFNPAVLWISSWISEERENCCDDMALGQMQNKTGLAEALISFKQHQLYGSSLQTAFSGKKNQLLRRVSRILGIQDKSGSFTQKLFLGIAFILLLGSAGAMMLIQNRQPAKIKNREASKNNVQVKPTIYAIVLPEVKNTAQKETFKKVIALRKKTTVAKKTVAMEEASEPVMVDKVAALTDQQMEALDREQAIKDMAGAKLDQDQALRDQQQALLDQQQYITDFAHAQLAKEKAKLDREQALKDKKEAERRSIQNQSIFTRP